MIQKLFISAMILIHAGFLNAMISYNHCETDRDQQVFLGGDVHKLDERLGLGFSKRLLMPLIAVLKEGTPPLRIPIILEMNKDFWKTGIPSVVAPLCEELCTSYRELLHRSDNPWFLKLVDGRGNESDFCFALTGYLSALIQNRISSKNLLLFSTKRKNFREKKSELAACLEELKKVLEVKAEGPSIQVYLQSLIAQQQKLAVIAETWKDHEKAARVLAEALGTHAATVEAIRNRVATIPQDINLWEAFVAPFLRQKTTCGFLECFEELEMLIQNTENLFQDICLLNALLEFFDEGHKAVVIFAGNTHARVLSALFQRETGLGWKSIAQKTCLEGSGTFLMSYSIDADFAEQLARAGRRFIEDVKRKEKPLVSFEEQCYHCFNTSDTPMASCGTCNKAKYCCKECQLKNWRLHKGFCVAEKK